MTTTTPAPATWKPHRGHHELAQSRPHPRHLLSRARHRGHDARPGYAHPAELARTALRRDVRRPLRPVPREHAAYAGASHDGGLGSGRVHGLVAAGVLRALRGHDLRRARRHWT